MDELFFLIGINEDEEGEPWFVAKDVCEILELADVNRSTARLLGTMKGTHTVSTPGGPQDMITISEAGVYRLVFTSRKPEAERFMDWIAIDVLPSVRRHGAYMIPEAIETYPVVILNRLSFIIFVFNYCFEFNHQSN